MTDKQKLKVCRDALANIMKLAGVCWDGRRLCHDPQAVAERALRKVDPEFLDSIDHEQYDKYYVKRDGSFHRKVSR